MNRYEWNQYYQKQIAYQQAMQPILTAYCNQLKALPVRYIKDDLGCLTIDLDFPPERRVLRTQLNEIAKSVYESLRME